MKNIFVARSLVFCCLIIFPYLANNYVISGEFVRIPKKNTSKSFVFRIVLLGLV